MSNLKLGLQLYSVRDDMEKSVENTLTTVAAAGYDCVEFAGFFDKPAEEICEILDKCNLKAVSVHQNFRDVLTDTENQLEYLKKVGLKYLVMPGFGRQCHAGGEDFAKTVDELKRAAKLLSQIGIQLCYHNHYAEFEKHGGKYLLDCLFESVPEIQPEIDTAWVNYAGLNPCEYLAKYAGRIEVVHLKDYTVKDGEIDFKHIGGGCMDIPPVIKAAETAGAKYIFVEQDESKAMPALESVKKSAEFIKSVM